MELCEMMQEYRRGLQDLYRRREEMSRKIGAFGRRLAVLDEEIDEMEEALMHMRAYAAAGR